MPANISQTTPRWLDNNLITHLIPLATGRRQKPEAMRPGQICAQPITVQTTKTGRSKNGSEHGFENGSEHGFVVFLAQRSPHLSPAHDTRLSHAPDNAPPTENYSCGFAYCPCSRRVQLFSTNAKWPTSLVESQGIHNALRICDWFHEVYC